MTEAILAFPATSMVLLMPPRKKEKRQKRQLDLCRGKRW